MVDARAVLIAGLRSRQAEIERTIFVRVTGDRFERTGVEDREYVEGLRVAGEAGLEYVLTGVELWGSSLTPVPREVLVQAGRAARAGVGLDTVLRRYVAAHAVLEDFVVWELEREHSRDPWLGAGVLRGVLGAIAALMDRLIRVVSGAYNQEAEHVAAATAEEAARSPAHKRGLEGARGGEPERTSARALVPGGRRSGECLAYLADHPGASNSEVAAAIGVIHGSQISKLLCDLQKEGFVVKGSGGRPGTPNAWRLSPSGEARMRSLGGRDERS